MHTDLVKGTMFIRVTWSTLPLYLLGLVVIVFAGIGFVFIGRMIGKLKKIDRIHKLSFYIIYLCFGIMILFSEKDYFVEDNVMKAYTNYKLTLLMMVGIMIIILISINQMDKRVLRIENNLLKKQNELQYANYIGMQQYELELHKLYHDIGNHIKTIQILVDQGNKQEAKNYTEDLINQYRVIAKDYYCSNKILNAVLLNKVKICEENNITTQIDLQIPENISVRDIDLMCIFANLLDNAIEGCRRNLNACNYIHIKTAVMNNFYTIFVINSKDMTPSIIDAKGRYATTKQDKKLHGYGLRILDEIIERYKGQKEFIDRGDEFTAMIMLML
jgi:sensor histidine kinase regulating citrate/malate metabolism